MQPRPLHTQKKRHNITTKLFFCLPPIFINYIPLHPLLPSQPIPPPRTQGATRQHDQLLTGTAGARGTINTPPLSSSITSTYTRQCALLSNIEEIMAECPPYDDAPTRAHFFFFFVPPSYLTRAKKIIKPKPKGYAKKVFSARRRVCVRQL